jgi:hypothetical protein
VDAVDDLVGVDALEVDRGHAEVAVCALTWDDVQPPKRHTSMKYGRGFDTVLWATGLHAH